MRSLTWNTLPRRLRDELDSRGMGRAWYVSQAPGIQVTVVNLYVKLRAHDLWRFVAAEHDSGLGCLHFLCTDIDELLEHLRGSRSFTAPKWRGEHWQVRERRVHGALHFKHFEGWPADKVQAHIDRSGAWLPWWCWLFPIVPLVLLLRHALHYDSYRDVERIRAQLRSQGFDPGSLRPPGDAL